MDGVTRDHATSCRLRLPYDITRVPSGAQNLKAQSSQDNCGLSLNQVYVAKHRVLDQTP